MSAVLHVQNEEHTHHRCTRYHIATIWTPLASHPLSTGIYADGVVDSMAGSIYLRWCLHTQSLPIPPLLCAAMVICDDIVGNPNPYRDLYSPSRLLSLASSVSEIGEELGAQPVVQMCLSVCTALKGPVPLLPLMQACALMARS